MSNQAIPAEAVEAAARAFREHPKDNSVGSVDEAMRLALEAAAPHMQAAAFEDAADAFGEAASWSDSHPSPEQVQRWLRSRAKAYRPTP